MNEKEIQFVDVLQMVLVVAVIVFIFKGGSSTSNTTTSYGGSTGMSEDQQLARAVMPYVFIFE